MPPRDGHVVEEDLAVVVPAGGDHVLVEQEPAAGARALLHDEQRAARGQGVDGGRVDGVEVAVGGVGLLGGVPMLIVAVASSTPGRLGRRRRAQLGAAAGSRSGRRRGSACHRRCRTASAPPRTLGTVGPLPTLSRGSRVTVAPNLPAADRRSRRSGATAARSARALAGQPSRVAWYAAESSSASSELASLTVDVEQPAAAVRVVVDQLGGRVEGLVAGDDRAGDRGVDVADRLGRLELAAGAAGLAAPPPPRAGRRRRCRRARPGRSG